MRPDDYKYDPITGVIVKRAEVVGDVHDIAFDGWWASVVNSAPEISMKHLAKLAYIAGASHGVALCRQDVDEILSKPFDHA